MQRVYGATATAVSLSPLPTTVTLIPLPRLNSFARQLSTMASNNQQIISVREQAMTRFRQNPDHFPLLALPVELRCMVYAEVFRGAMVQFSTKGLSQSILSFGSLPENVNLNIAKYTSHRNILMSSKIVYNEAIDEYWKAMFVHIPQAGLCADLLFNHLRADSIAKIRKLRLDGPVTSSQARHLAKHLPNLRKLHLASPRTDLMWNPHTTNQPTQEEERFARMYGEVLFSGIPDIFASFAKDLQITVGFNVDVITDNDPTSRVPGKHVSTIVISSLVAKIRD